MVVVAEDILLQLQERIPVELLVEGRFQSSDDWITRHPKPFL